MPVCEREQLSESLCALEGMCGHGMYERVQVGVCECASYKELELIKVNMMCRKTLLENTIKLISSC